MKDIDIRHTTDLQSPFIPEEENDMSRRYLRIIEKWIPTGVEYFTPWPGRPGCGHFFGGCHWYGLETIAPAETFACASLSPEYKEKNTGISRKLLQEMAVKAVRYLCFTHDTGPEDCVRPEKGLGRPETCNNKWGERGHGFFRESQCGTTVAGIARICLMLRESIDEETWMMAARIHADYAERFGNMPPQNGIYIDTQTEENAWTSKGLTSCFLFLSGHEKAPDWEKLARRWMFSTCSAPQDHKDGGQLVRSIAAMGRMSFTTLPDYWAENHGMVHPNYTASGVSSLMSVGTQLKLWGRQLPPELYWNRQRVYENLKSLTDGAGCTQAVQGMDWHYLRTVGCEIPHAIASVFFKDPDAAALQRIGLRNSELRQDANGGRLYDKDFAEKAHDAQDPMIMRETTVSAVAHLYLLHRLFGPGTAPSSETEREKRLRGVRSYPHAGFLHHRHSKGQTSLAWRNSIMALPLTREGIYTIGPCSGTWLGSPVVKDRPDSHYVRNLHIAEHDDAVAAALIIDRCQNSLRQYVMIASLPDGRLLSFERFTALENISSLHLDQGLLQITNENFPLYAKHNNGNCRGERTLFLPEDTKIFKGWLGDKETDDVIDDLGQPEYLNIDNRIGIRFAGSGRAVYHNRHWFKPYRAIADDLILSRIDNDTDLRPGDTAGELCALLAPEQHSADTPSMMLAAPDGPVNSACLACEDYMAAANFETDSRRLTFSLPPGEKITAYSGAILDINTRKCSYHIPLRAESACLLKACCSLRVTGEMIVDATSGGTLYATNTGGEMSRIEILTEDGMKDSAEIKPGSTRKML